MQVKDNMYCSRIKRWVFRVVVLRAFIHVNNSTTSLLKQVVGQQPQTIIDNQHVVNWVDGVVKTILTTRLLKGVNNSKS